MELLCAIEAGRADGILKGDSIECFRFWRRR